MAGICSLDWWAASAGCDLAESRYRSGLSTQLALLNAESTLLSARQQVAGIIANEAIERITLLLSVGGGFNPAASDPAADKEKP